MSYTISNITEAGETHETFGTKYSVKFAEDPGTYELWYKRAPDTGTVVEGNIENGRFKKVKKEWNGATSSGASYKKPYAAQQADKSDGMRQGMCINNAAQYVQASAGKTLSPLDWANAVHKYATALYRQGDLTSEDKQAKEVVPTTVAEGQIDLSAIEDVFSGN